MSIIFPLRRPPLEKHNCKNRKPKRTRRSFHPRFFLLRTRLGFCFIVGEVLKCGERRIASTFLVLIALSTCQLPPDLPFGLLSDQLPQSFLLQPPLLEVVKTRGPDPNQLNDPWMEFLLLEIKSQNHSCRTSRASEQWLKAHPVH